MNQEAYRLVSVDVWDTVLRRVCHPEAIKLSTAWHFFLGFQDSIKPEFDTPHKLHQARVRAEMEIAQSSLEAGFDDEYPIKDVITAWVNTVSNVCYSDDVFESLVAYEISVEIACTYVDPGIVAMLSGIESEEMIFLSDFYMSSDMLNRIIESKPELDGVFTGGVSSCDKLLNKKSKRLFKYIHELYNVSADEHCHIGDNCWSDVEAPQTIGIASFEYRPEDQHQLREKKEAVFQQPSLIPEACFQQFLGENDRRAGGSLPKGENSQQFFDCSMLVLLVLSALESGVSNDVFRRNAAFNKARRVLCPDGNFFGHEIDDLPNLRQRKRSLQINAGEVNSPFTGLFETLLCVKSRWDGMVKAVFPTKFQRNHNEKPPHSTMARVAILRSISAATNENDKRFLTEAALESIAGFAKGLEPNCVGDAARIWRYYASTTALGAPVLAASLVGWQDAATQATYD